MKSEPDMEHPKITMTLLVRDEEDIIEDNIWFHHEQGIDNFLITDNLSTDRTADIIKSLSRELDIEYFFQPDDDYSQYKWVTEMARRASRDHATDWIIHSDADEFWKADDGTLKSFLSGVPQDVGVLRVRRYNAVPVYEQRNPLAAMCHQRRTQVFECNSVNNLVRALPAKCIHRPSDSVKVEQGNHSVTGISGSQTDVESGLGILHFPHRTLEQYKQKILLGGAAYAANTVLPKTIGETWRKHYNMLKTEGVDDYWRGLALSKQDVMIDLKMGTLFQDTTIIDTFRLRGDQPREIKTLEAVTKLQQKSQPLIKEMSLSLAEHISRVSKELRPTRPLYYNLEFCVSGPERQLEQISDLQTSKSSADLCKNFAKLRDTYSLFPKNFHFKQFLGEVLEIEFPEEVARLRADCEGKIVVLHTSCAARVRSAEQSIASFGEGDERYHHILLLGERQFQQEDEIELTLRYDGHTLTVPVPDNYESLHRKVFYALTLIDLASNPSFVLKLDDDLFLRDGEALTALLEDLASKSVEYAGRTVGAAHHKDHWHGWHLAKCEDQIIEQRGYQFPLPRKYAAGGYGYVLGRKGLEACSYMYLATKEFFAMRAIGLEDVYVGHALYGENIELVNVSSEEHILAMPGLTFRHLTDQADIATDDSKANKEAASGSDTFRRRTMQSLSGLFRRGR